MASTVKARQNHYELLGLKPTASPEEIGRAFAREVGLFRPRQFGGVAEIGLAYETLRNPAKRAAYDASIGVAKKPAPAPRPYITNAVFVTATPKYSPEHGAPSPKPAASPVAPPRAAKPEPSPLPFIKAGPTEPAQRIVERPPQAAGRLPTFALDAEDRPIEFNRTMAIAGALTLAVAVTAAWAGTQAGRDAQAAQPESVVTTTVPKPRLSTAVAEPARVPPAPQAQQRFAAAPAAPRMVRAVASRPEGPAPQVRSVGEQNRFARESIAQAVAEQPSVAETTAPAIAASMPLPAATVARTIDRIGYSCGKVSSTVAAEAAGVFTVTCTSGQSFQARPVGGRYRFRRLGR